MSERRLADGPDLPPPPDEVAAEVVENLETALDHFRNAAKMIERQVKNPRQHAHFFDVITEWGISKLLLEINTLPFAGT